MKKISYIISALVMTAFSFHSQAQTFETGYFLDNYSFSGKLNPAFQSETNVIAFAIGGIQTTAASNIGLGNVLFSRNGQLVFGLNKSVSAAEFLSGLKDINSTTEDLGMNILTIGFYGKNKKSYHTIDANLRVLTTVNVPYELFEFIKKGGARTYSIAGVAADCTSYIDLGYSYSRTIGEKVKVGGRLKLLIGAANVGAVLDNLVYDGTRLSLQGGSTIRIAQPFVSLPKSTQSVELKDLQFNGTPGIGGFGAAVDLGVSVTPVEGLEASLALVDLGGISWNYNLSGVSDFNVKSSDIKEKSDKIITDVTKFNFSEGGKSFDKLPLTVNGGVRYTMPFYKGLSAGVFGTYRNYKGAAYANARLGATVTPAKWFSFTANYGIGTYGSSFGSAFSISGGAFNLYLGAETFLGKMAAFAPVPLGAARVSITGGITFRFGGKNNE